MKKHIRLTALLCVLFLLLSLGASAEGEEEPWVEEYYRVIDYTHTLTDEEYDQLDAACIDLMRRFRVDMTLLVVTDESLEGGSAAELAREKYEHCSFGYGPGKNGFMAVYNADSEEVSILCFGNAAARMDEDYRAFLCLSAPGYREQQGIPGVLYAVLNLAFNYLEEHPDATADPNGRGGTADKPYWYPNNPESFEKYHDPDAPRVVDTADIFTDDEESEMEARLAEIRAELDKDIVVFTDVSAYGLGHAVYSADFYDFNGYGIGPEYEGVCLFVCMDPDDRGFWTCCTGPETRGLFTESIANQLDDRLYDYMVSGDYGSGAADWIENFRNLYRTGMPFPPEWLPEQGSFTRTHDASAPRVTDELGLLSAEEERDLTAQAKALSDKYGLDVAVATLNNTTLYFNRDFLNLFYEVRGYGFGEDYDGILLALVRDNYHSTSCYVMGWGKGADRLTDVNEGRINSRVFNKYLDANAGEALSLGLKNIDHMEKTGRVARTGGYWIFITVFGAAVGAIVGGIGLSGAKKRMASPSVRLSAGDYLVRDSLRVDRSLDQYLSTTTTRKYSPVERSSGGGSSGGGGRSSYSSSYSGSSGTSHSGSGRSF